MVVVHGRFWYLAANMPIACSKISADHPACFAGMTNVCCQCRGAGLQRVGADPPTKAAPRLSETFRHHFVCVRAEIGGGEDAPQLALYERLACWVVAAPRAERLNKARGRRRVDRVERDDLVGEEHIAGAVRSVKMHLVTLRNWRGLETVRAQ